MHFKKPCLLIVGLTGLVRPALADWQLVGGSLNINQNQTASHPCIALSGATPYVAWEELNGSISTMGTISQVYCKNSGGALWQPVANYLNYASDAPATYPSLTFSGTTPYLAWQEVNASLLNQVYIKFHNGSAWQAVGGTVNKNADGDATRASLAFSGATPYVAWQESVVLTGSYQIFVKYFNGSAWQQAGGALNVNASHDANLPFLAIRGTTPYVAFYEYNGSSPQLYTRFYNGSVWTLLGGSLNVNASSNAGYHTLAFSNTTPYIAWSENNGAHNQMYVKYYNASAWQQVGGILNANASQDANHPAIAFSGTTPYVTWFENNGTTSQVYTNFYNGSAWRPFSGSLNQNGSHNAIAPFLVFSGTTPYVTWDEDNGAGKYQVYVKAFFPPTATSTSTLTFTATATVTRTSTYSPTRTGTYTATPTQTFSPTHSATRTISSTFTFPPTLTSSATATFSPTNSSSATPPPSSTPTPALSSTTVFTPTSTPDSGLIQEGDFLQVTAYPSPATGDKIFFRYSLPESGRILITLYNLAGEKIGSLENRHAEAGRFTSGLSIPAFAPGVYLYRFRATADSGRIWTLPLQKFVVARQ